MNLAMIGHVFSVLMLVESPMFVWAAWKAGQEHKTLLRRLYQVWAVGFALFGASNIVPWALSHSPLASDAGDIMGIIGSVLVVYGSVSFYRIPKDQRYLKYQANCLRKRSRSRPSG